MYYSEAYDYPASPRIETNADSSTGVKFVP